MSVAYQSPSALPGPPPSTAFPDDGGDGLDQKRRAIERQQQSKHDHGSTNNVDADADADTGYSPLQSSSQASGTSRFDGWAAAGGGARFAPVRVPLVRRLQTAAVLVHCVSFVTCVTTFLLLCSVPPLWPAIIVYLVYMYASSAHLDGSLWWRSELFRSLPQWRLFATYFPMRLHKTHDLPPTRRYIFGYHPHGIIAHGAFMAFSTNAMSFGKLFPGITNTLLTLDFNFRVPIYREWFLLVGLASVSRKSIENLLSRGGHDGRGAGRAVTIVVGGARESLEARPRHMRLIIKDRKGFVKMAIRLGADLVPVLGFGENDMYDQLDPKTHPKLHNFQTAVLKWLRFTLPAVHGRAVFNYDFGILPYRRPVNIVVGKPIMVTMSNDPPQAEIDQLHALYMTELQRIWDTYKDQFAPDRQEEFCFIG